MACDGAKVGECIRHLPDAPREGKSDASPATWRRAGYVTTASVPLKVKHVTESPRRAAGPAQLGAYPGVFIDFYGGGDAGSVLGTDTRILGRRLGVLRPVHGRERHGHHGRLSSPVGPQN